MQNYSNKMEKDFKEFDATLDSSRQLSISAISKLVFLSSGIVGFSVSIFSISALQAQLNLETIRLSWYFFVGVIILGFFILIFEGRIRYAKTWKNFQVSTYPDVGKYEYLVKERITAIFITIITIFYPANLLFNRMYDSKKEKYFKTKVNGLVVHKLASIENLLPFLENIVFILFICGIITLITSFKI